jgi:hypothetical protein
VFSCRSRAAYLSTQRFRACFSYYYSRYCYPGDSNSYAYDCDIEESLRSGESCQLNIGSVVGVDVRSFLLLPLLATYLALSLFRQNKANRFYMVYIWVLMPYFQVMIFKRPSSGDKTADSFSAFIYHTYNS